MANAGELQIDDQIPTVVPTRLDCFTKNLFPNEVCRYMQIWDHDPLVYAVCIYIYIFFFVFKFAFIFLH